MIFDVNSIKKTVKIHQLKKLPKKTYFLVAILLVFLYFLISHFFRNNGVMSIANQVLGSLFFQQTKKYVLDNEGTNNGLGDVLAAADENIDRIYTVDSYDNDMAGSHLQINLPTLFSDNVYVRNGDIDVGEGSVYASNLVYSVSVDEASGLRLGGDDQNPEITFEAGLLDGKIVKSVRQLVLNDDMVGFISDIVADTGEIQIGDEKVEITEYEGDNVDIEVDSEGKVTFYVDIEAAFGEDKQIQFNDGGVTSGAEGLYWDKDNKRLGINIENPENELDVEGTIQASDEILGNSLTINEDGDFGGDMTLGNDLTVGNDAVIEGSLGVVGDIKGENITARGVLTGLSLFTVNDGEIGGTLKTGDDLIVEGDIFGEGDLTINENGQIGGDLLVNKDIQAIGNISGDEITANTLLKTNELRATGEVYFTDISPSGLLYTTPDGKVTTVPPFSGGMGYWNKTGDYLKPIVDGDDLYLPTGSVLGIGYDTTTIINASAAFSDNVGIGTASPTAKLDIIGSTADDSKASLHAKNSVGDSIVYVRNDGNVGIGTVLPTNTLDVNGTIGATGNIQSDADILGVDLFATGNVHGVNFYSSGSIFTDGDLVINGVELGKNDSIDSGATRVGVFDDSMTHIANNTDVQTAVKSLDTAIVDLDASIGSGIGNQLLGMNSAGSAKEWKTITGTVDQIAVNHAVEGINLTLPQDIATTSSPTFANLTVSGDVAAGSFNSLVLAEEGDGFSIEGGVVDRKLTVTGGDKTIQGTGSLIDIGGDMTTASVLNFGAGSSGLITLGSGTNSLTLTTTGNTNVVLPLSGTLSTLANVETLSNKTMGVGSTWNGNTVEVEYGGTGLTSVSEGQLLYGSDTNVYSRLPPPTQSGQYLRADGAGSFEWAIIDPPDLPDIPPGSNNYIQNQLSAPQTADLWIGGEGRFGSDPNSAVSVANGQISTGSNSDLAIMPNGTGNLGVNTTAPGSKLEVKGATSDDTTSALHAVDAGGASLFYIRNDGNVGIGTNVPDYALDVVGDVSSTANVRAGNDLYISGVAISENTNINSGSSKVGVYDDSMNHITGDTNVQGAIKQLDSAIYTLGTSIGDGTGNQMLGMNAAGTAKEWKTILGTVNQISVTHSPGGIGLTLPQDIATTSSPSFAGLTMTGNVNMGNNGLTNIDWTASDDGAGSSLDADFLDGWNLDVSSAGNTVVGRNSSGDINARLFRSEYDSTNSNIGYIMTQVDTGSNNYIRPSTPAQVLSALGLTSGAGNDIWVDESGDNMTGSLDMNNNDLLDVNQIRADVFEDAGNTAYHLDPADTGTSLRIAGSIVMNSGETVDGVDISAYSPYFINSAGSNGKVWKSDGSGRGYWGNDINTDTQNLGTSGNSITLTNGGSVVAPYANNAGLLDNYNSSVSNVDSTVVVRSGSGDIYQRYGFGSYFNMSHSVSTRNSDTIFYSSSDDYIRKNNATGMRNSLNVPTRTGSGASGTWGINITGTADYANNSNLLDGHHGSYYLDNTDTQNLGTSGNSITLTNGGSVTAPYANNANLLDGHNSTYFMNASTDNWVNTTGDTMTGNLTVASEGSAGLQNSELVVEDSSDMSVDTWIVPGENTVAEGNHYQPADYDMLTLNNNHSNALGAGLMFRVAHSGGVSSAKIVTSPETTGRRGSRLNFFVRANGTAGSNYQDSVLARRMFLDSHNFVLSGAVTPRMPGGGTWSDTSDERLKTNINSLENALDIIDQLKPVNFNWINPEEHGGYTSQQTGFIAQDIEKIFPDWVNENKAEGDDALLTNGEKAKNIRLPIAFNAYLVKAIQEQQEQIEANTDGVAVVGPLVDEINKEQQIQRAEIDGINVNVANMEDILNNMQGEVAGVNTEINNINDDIYTVTNDISGINSDLNNITGQVATVSTDVENVKNELLSLTSLNTKFVDLDKKLTEISEQTTTKISQLELDVENLQDATADLDELRAKIKELEEQVLGASGSATIDTSTDSGTLITAEQDATFNSLIVTGDSNLYNLAVAGNLTAGVIAVDGEEGSIGTLAQPFKLQPLGIEGIEMVGGKVNIDKDGNVALKEGDISVEKGKIKGNDEIRGSVIMQSGQTEVPVNAIWGTKPKSINVTATFNSNVWVEDLNENGFVIKVADDPGGDKEIFWQAFW